MAELKLTPVELRSFYFESGKEHTPPDKVARQGYKGYRTWSIKTWKSSAYKIIGRIIFDKNQLKTLQNTKITKITILYTTESPTPKKTSSIHARKIQLNEYNSSNQNFNYDSCGNLIGSFNGSQENPGKERTYELSESSTGDDQNLFQGLVSYLQRPDTQGIVLGTDAPYFRDGITDSFIYENYITLDENFISLTNFILEVELLILTLWKALIFIKLDLIMLKQEQLQILLKMFLHIHGIMQLIIRITYYSHFLPLLEAVLKYIVIHIMVMKPLKVIIQFLH